MPDKRPRDLLVCYDVRDPRRLARVHARLCAWGIRLQYSVFYCRMTPAALKRLTGELRALIDEANDDVRIYRIEGLDAIAWHGPEPFGDALQLYL